jgi:protein-tyrosine phosphatase
MPKRVLFLCTGNYYRSRLAEELFNHRAHNLKLDWQASSCALAIETGEENVGPISEHTLAALSKLSVPLSAPLRFPVACTEQALESANLVIAMKEAEHRSLVETRFHAWANRVVYWHVHDLNVVADSAATAALIDTLIDRLIEEIR